MSATFVLDFAATIAVILGAGMLVFLFTTNTSKLVIAGCMFESMMALISLAFTFSPSEQPELAAFLFTRTTGRLIEAIVFWVVISVKIHRALQIAKGVHPSRRSTDKGDPSDASYSEQNIN